MTNTNTKNYAEGLYIYRVILPTVSPTLVRAKMGRMTNSKFVYFEEGGKQIVADIQELYEWSLSKNDAIERAQELIALELLHLAGRREKLTGLYERMQYLEVE